MNNKKHKGIRRFMYYMNQTDALFYIMVVTALGVYLHGLCGDLAAAEKGKRSMLAGDIIEALPQALAIGEEESKL